jgi:transposase
LNDNEPTQNIYKSNESFPKLLSKPKRCISDEQKTIKNALTRERRTTKSDEKIQNRELFNFVNTVSNLLWKIYVLDLLTNAIMFIFQFH